MDKRIENFFKSMNGKKIAFCGIGTSNLPLIELFIKYGASVTACDRRTREQLGDSADVAQKAGAKLSLGDDYLKNLDVDIVFRTPGMRYYMDELVEMRNRGVVVTSEMEVFFDLCPCKIYAITGSDGKTTTTSIIAQMLQAQGKTVHLGGNIGKPLLPEIESIGYDDAAVVELSSFQLISMRKGPDVAVVTNLAKDRSVSTENARGALVTEYQRYEESVLREKSYALNMADRELIRLAVFDPHGVNDARELIATIMAAIDEAVEIKTIERLSRWEESERQKRSEGVV